MLTEENADDTATVLLAVAAVTHWFGLFAFLQPFEKTGYLVRAVVEILQATSVFMILLASLVLAGSHANYVIFAQTNEPDAAAAYGSVRNSVFSTVNTLLFTE
jgi:hypothetical protein